MVRISELEEYAKNNNIPIMETDGILFLTNYIKDNNIKNILEIGSAIGYSAIRMASLDKDIYVTTIERDIKRYNEAVKNIHNFNLENQIKIINGDALLTDIEGKYDLIFIDAAKSQYINFFEKYKVNLNDKGTIISDNLKFHGLIEGDYNILSRNVKGIVRKIKNYVQFLEDNKEFKTTFFEVGDGIGISVKN